MDENCQLSITTLNLRIPVVGQLFLSPDNTVAYCSLSSRKLAFPFQTEEANNFSGHAVLSQRSTVKALSPVWGFRTESLSPMAPALYCTEANSEDPTHLH